MLFFLRNLMHWHFYVLNHFLHFYYTIFQIKFFQKPYNIVFAKILIILIIIYEHVSQKSELFWIYNLIFIHFNILLSNLLTRSRKLHWIILNFSFWLNLVRLLIINWYFSINFLNFILITKLNFRGNILLLIFILH